MGFDIFKNADTRHKVFVSYYHKDDQDYKDAFEKTFSHLFINKSVKDGDINTDVSTEYIKRLIQQNFITDTAVLVVLFGPNTWGRKHVDWEISAALNKKVGGYSGLLGIVLPTVTLSDQGKVYDKDIPPRLLDNIKSGYAQLYTWNSIYKSDGSFIKYAIETAFNSRIKAVDKIFNSREQFTQNKSR